MLTSGVAEQQYKTDKKKYYMQLETMMGDIDNYIYSNKAITPETNMDRVYDELTTSEINKVFLKDKTLPKARQGQTAMVKYKESFAQKLANRAKEIYREIKEKIFNKDSRANASEVQNTGTVEPQKKKASWDLGNWTQKELDDARSTASEKKKNTKETVEKSLDD
ncbi:MAG: hypothetical protein IKD74_04400 [Clostridia bacterium]|nr:hypothetical protein [Clostridia bacterium]